ncbi:GNAT family N-acetyltransferase [Streptomyces sp. LE64]|uniref:GNAT family N-acetyltransferase n=1 Tax=Streptomyces sp. LE64 TaxID=3448653 RepID=UPI0040433AD0
MIEIQLLRADHADAVHAFERDNRAYFAAWVGDRGDDYFAEFAVRHRELLAEQATGRHLFHVVVDGAGEVLGRVNLVDIEDGEAELGYRIARRATGAGVATAAVRRVCETAHRYGLRSLRARATAANTGSRTVLARTGFTRVDDVAMAGGPGVLFRRSLGPSAD